MLEQEQAARILADGKDVGDVCRELQVTEQTFTGGGTSSVA